jgi:hypothetical protein
MDNINDRSVTSIKARRQHVKKKIPYAFVCQGYKSKWTCTNVQNNNTGKL